MNAASLIDDSHAMINLINLTKKIDLSMGICVTFDLKVNGFSGVL